MLKQKPVSFLERIPKELNPPQIEAVTYTDGPLLILAGAGSGKTRVIAYRIAYLIREKHLAPWQILAMTFTNKAAGEMRERVAALLNGEPSGLWIGTFHSICARILRHFGDKIGIDPHFTIYDRSDQSAAVKRAVFNCASQSKEIKPTQVLNAISRAKNRFEWPEQMEANAVDEQDHLLARIYREYQKILRENHALDFDDLLIEAVRLLTEKPEVGEMYQNRFRHVLIDEYQDTNHPQYLLLRCFTQTHNQICVVGDDDQSIYGWRGATIRNILEFERDFQGVHVVKLEQNYRSTQTILAAAGQVIKKNKGRHDKTLWTDGESGDKVGTVELPDELSEAYWVCDTAQRLHERKKIPFGEIAIFYRVNAQSRLFEEECIKRGIPYNLVGATAFYERKEIKDAVAYFRLLLNPSDTVSIQRIINVPARKLGEKSVQKLIAFAAQQNLPVLEAARRLPKFGRDADLSLNTGLAFAQFAGQFERWRKLTAQASLAKGLETVLKESGYWALLEEDSDPQAQARLENLEELLSAAGQFESSLKEESESPPDVLSVLESFLEKIALVSDADQVNESKDALLLMTLHSAKGLEFPYVFMVGMEEGLFPHSRSLDSNNELEEERRLCYVGITRAKKRVFLSCAESRRLYNRSEWARPSRFLKEIPAKYKEQLSWRGSRSLFDDEISPEKPAQKQSAVAAPSGKGISLATAKEKKELSFHPDDMVSHRTFGFGVVMEVEGEGPKTRITVEFQDFGKKTLLQEYARLEKV